MTNEFFFENDPADTHCVQACYQMLVGRATGHPVSVQEAEEQTGYEIDRLTWQFAMLNSLAERHDLYVVDFEDFSPDEFVAHPIQSIRSQIGDEDAVQYQIANTNLDAEVDRAVSALANPRITFVRGAPDLDDLITAFNNDMQIVCLVNGLALEGKEGYRPHSVVIRSVENDAIVIDDPGPPARPRWRVSKSAFMSGWADPSPSVTNFIACGPRPLDF